jgi:hypothetical protein
MSGARYAAWGWGLLFLVMGWVFAPCALATTQVSGNVDTNSPLVIDPTADSGSALTTQLDVSGAVPVMFIQKMPTTKIVSQVAIGNFTADPSCTAGTTLRLYVRDHPAGDLDTSTQIVSSPYTAAVPSGVSGQLTWLIPDTKLLKGHGYSFRVQRAGSSDCRWVQGTTWGHNGLTVNGGPAACVGGPVVGAGGTSLDKRMWHVAGQDDRVPGCVDRAAGSSRFDPRMPTGWLVSIYGSAWDSATAVCASFACPTSTTDYACTDSGRNNLASQYGARDVNYPPTLEDGKLHYVCQWNQWADRGADIPDGWYYGLPWISGTPRAYPRDRYLRLDTINYESYLRAYSPTLKYEDTELYYADQADEMTDNYGVRDGATFSNKLKRGESVLADANRASGLLYLSMAYLGSRYTDGLQAESGDSIDEDNGDYQGDAARMHNAGYGDQVYARAVHGSDGKLWLQYWMFFYYNTVAYFRGDHEGDWEMVQVGLNSNLQPDTVAYAEHDGGRRCAWTDVPKDASGVSPLSYVADGSHANYPASGVEDRSPLPNDWHLGTGSTIKPGVIIIHDDSPSWVMWPGQWGASGSSPAPPAHHQQWADPKTWSDGLSGCGGGFFKRQAAHLWPPRSRPTAPRIHARVAGDKMRLTYAFRQRAAGSRNSAPARALLVAISASGPGLAPRGGVYPVGATRRGRLSIPLPNAGSVYKVALVALSRRGHRSEVIRVRVSRRPVTR